MTPPRACWLSLVVVLSLPRPGWAAAEIKLDKDFLAGVVEKVPPCPFQKEGRYKGTIQSFRLRAIDPRTRRFHIACQVAGEFRAPRAQPRAASAGVAGPEPEDWRSFKFDIRAAVNIEPGGDGTPRFRVEVEEVRRRELEGVAGTLAKVLGRSFDALVKQVAEGKTTQLNNKLNAEVLKRVQAFTEYGVLCAIDYAPDQVAFHFDVSRYQADGIAGYVFAEPGPGTVPLTRWVHRQRADRIYTIKPSGPDHRVFRSEGVACHVFDHPEPGTVPLYRWRGRWDHLYTTAPDGEGAIRRGYHLEGIACHVYPDPNPGTVPLYRFVEHRLGLHFYTTDRHAEFAK